MYTNLSELISLHSNVLNETHFCWEIFSASVNHIFAVPIQKRITKNSYQKRRLRIPERAAQLTRFFFICNHRTQQRIIAHIIFLNRNSIISFHDRIFRMTLCAQEIGMNCSRNNAYILVIILN